MSDDKIGMKDYYLTVEDKAYLFDTFKKQLTEKFMEGWDETEEDFIEGECLGLDNIGEWVLLWVGGYNGNTPLYKKDLIEHLVSKNQTLPSKKPVRKPDERHRLMIRTRINNIREQLHVVGMYLQEIEKWHGPNIDPTRLAVYGVLNEVKVMEEEVKGESLNVKGGEK